MWNVVDRDMTQGMPDKNQIVRHKSGAIILRCPKCNAVQFTCSEITGPDDAPTLKKMIQCGAGMCKKCGVWFGITAGKTIYPDTIKTQLTPIPEKLSNAGIKRK